MLIKLCKKLWARSNYKMLKEILSSPSNQEYFMDVKRDVPLSPGQIKTDASKVLDYVKTSGYSIWSQEAWSRVIVLVHELKNENLTNEQANFYRGSLSEALNLLEISYKANRTLMENHEAKTA